MIENLTNAKSMGRKMAWYKGAGPGGGTINAYRRPSKNQKLVSAKSAICPPLVHGAGELNLIDLSMVLNNVHIQKQCLRIIFGVVKEQEKKVNKVKNKKKGRAKSIT